MNGMAKKDLVLQVVESESVAAVSTKNRVDALVDGYVREIYVCLLVPVEVASICKQYIGDSKNVCSHKSMTANDTKTEAFYGKYCMKMTCFILIVIKLCIDITALIVAITSDYNHEIPGHVVKAPVPPPDVTTWIYVGCITDIVISIFQSAPVALQGTVSCYFVALLTPFYAAWIVFGSMLWWQLGLQSNAYPLLSHMILSWCITQTISGLVTLCVTLQSNPWEQMQGYLLSIKALHLSLYAMSAAVSFGSMEMDQRNWRVNALTTS